MLPLTMMGQLPPINYYQFNQPSPLGNMTGGGTYVIEQGAVGTCLTWNSNAGGMLETPSMTSSQYSVQLLFRSNYETARVRNSSVITWSNLYIGFEYPSIIFRTSASNTLIKMDGINRRSWDYLFDGNWHHLSATISATVKTFYIDGQKIFEVNESASANSGVARISWGVNYTKLKGSIDEVAFYSGSISAYQVYQNYLDFKAGVAYQQNLAPSLPTPEALTGTLDTREFTKDVAREVQLSQYPLPRYKTGNTLIKNFNWMDPKFMGGTFQPGITNAQAATNAVTIQTELAKNWNYFYLVATGQGLFQDAYTAGANANPSFKLSAIILRAQLNGNNPELKRQDKTALHYLQNSSGQFLDQNGNVTSTKIWRPTAPTSSYSADGQNVLSGFNYLFSQLSGSRTVDMVNENGELFPHITDAAMAKDPEVVSAKNASGLDYPSFFARKFAENETQSYRDIFMAHPRLQSGKFTEYAIDGQPVWRFKYSEARKVNSLINGQYYSTPDFYPRWPDNWRYWQTAWHGWQWIVESRVNEISVGDKLYSPFVAAGWSATEHENVRPAQWLGLLKCLSASGAEFYYTGFFSLDAPWPDSKNWIWQAATPSYAQAITSYVEPFLRSGDLMNGDIPDKWESATPNAGYNFYTGRNNTLVVVRKMTGVAKYYITGTIQPLSNFGDGTPKEASVTIQLDGQPLTFQVRRQGSCYVYDRSITPPTFVQLDSWHEDSHYLYWSEDFRFESEVMDSGSGTITTYPVSVTDYSSFTTTYTGNASYLFTPRKAFSLYVYVKAKGSGTIQATIGSTSQPLCFNSSNLVWVRSASPVVVSSAAALSISSQLEVDQIVLSANPSLYVSTPCNVPTCTWVVGDWSDWSECVGGTQSRNRSVIASPAGCTPPPPIPHSSESQSCVMPPPSELDTVTNLRVFIGNWGGVQVFWSYGVNPENFETEFIRVGNTIQTTYRGSVRKISVRLKRNTDYTFRIRAKTAANYSQWSELKFKTK